jgi:carbonic anhydrase/acetyltransferase-like protein (isoleucine patch superfamily)
MSIATFEAHSPAIDPSAWVHASAVIIGQVALEADVSVWPQVVVRGDVNRIQVGARTNLQDGAVLHVTHAGPYTGKGYPLSVGAEVTVGHRAILHACTIGERCVIGMAATVMDGAVLEANVLLGAGSLVPPGKRLEGNSLWVGSPARRVRALNEGELAWLEYSALHYVKLKDRHRTGSSLLPGSAP